MEVGNLKISGILVAYLTPLIVVSAKDIVSAKEIFVVVALYDAQNSMIKSSQRKTSRCKGPPFEWNQSFDLYAFCFVDADQASYTTSNISGLKIKVKKKGTFRSSTIGEFVLPFTSLSKDKQNENWHKMNSKSDPKALVCLKYGWEKVTKHFPSPKIIFFLLMKSKT